MLTRIFIFLFHIKGWKTTPTLPKNIKKGVILGIPHTSNWDFIFGLATLKIFNLKTKFTIKKEWTQFPFKTLMNKLGAIGITRNHPLGLSQSQQMAKIFQDEEDLFLLITPEGTRSPKSRWKTGFFYIAQEAKVPIILGYLDYDKKLGGFGPIIDPAIGFDAVMKEMREFYSKVSPKHPELFALDEYHGKP